MSAFSPDSADPRLADTVEDDHLLLSPANIAAFYAQVRRKFPDKHFPVDATFDQMVEVVRAFHDGTKMADELPT